MRVGVSHGFCLFATTALAVAGAAIPKPPDTKPAPALVLKTDDLVPKAKAAPIHAVHVPVLLYHHICGIKDPVNVTIEDFEWQMKFLMDNNYIPVSVDQIALAMQGDFKLPEKPVAITFDDGWQCAYKNAVPILDRYSMKATFFLVSKQAGGHTFMTWDEDRLLIKNGHWIGSHTVDHAWLTKLNDADLEKEMVNSKKTLEAKLGIKINGIAYPYGSYNEKSIKAAKKAGYLNAAVVGDGHHCQAPLFEIRRTQVSYGADLNSFRSTLGLPREEHNAHRVPTKTEAKKVTATAMATVPALPELPELAPLPPRQVIQELPLLPIPQ